VVEELDLDQSPHLDEVAGEADVGFGGGGIAAGMVVDQDHRRGPTGHGQREHPARMDEDGIEGPQGDEIGTDESPTGVQAEDMEVLDGHGAILLPEQTSHALWRIDHRRIRIRLPDQSLGEEEG